MLLERLLLHQLLDWHWLTLKVKYNLAIILKRCNGLIFFYYLAKQYEESYSVYEKALQWLANSDSEKSLILVAMSAMVYTFQGENDTKSLLFQW